jgi:hypothetical protein
MTTEQLIIEILDDTIYGNWKDAKENFEKLPFKMNMNEYNQVLSELSNDDLITLAKLGFMTL